MLRPRPHPVKPAVACPWVSALLLSQLCSINSKQGKWFPHTGFPHSIQNMSRVGCFSGRFSPCIFLSFVHRNARLSCSVTQWHFFNNLAALFQRTAGKPESRVQLTVFSTLDVSPARCCLHGWGFTAGDSGSDGLHVLGPYSWKEDQSDWTLIFCASLCDPNGTGPRPGHPSLPSQSVGLGFSVQKACGVTVGF